MNETLLEASADSRFPYVESLRVSSHVCFERDLTCVITKSRLGSGHFVTRRYLETDAVAELQRPPFLKMIWDDHWQALSWAYCPPQAPRRPRRTIFWPHRHRRMAGK